MITRAPAGRRASTAPSALLLLLLSLATGGCVTVSSETDATSGQGTAPPTQPPRVAPTSAGSSTATLPSASATPASTRLPSAGHDPSRIGYISLDDGIPFARAVADGVRDEALGAGLEVLSCDSGWTRSGALGCAQQLAQAGVGGIISFQPFADITGEVCAIGVPVLGIVFDQGPCQVSLLEIDQAESGRLAGAAVGRFASERWDCEVNAFISLESSDADPSGRARMQGYRDGYRESCAMPPATITLDDADRVATARTVMGSLLDTLTGDRVIVVGLNEGAILGAMSAASSAGREDDLWYSGQLADPSIRQSIACDDHYIASVAQFPERFGALLVPALVDAMAGGTVPSHLEAPLRLVDSGNVRDLYPDTPTCNG